MSGIRILSEEVINKIAAGEVVERPASVVKELLENSLDAEASRIEVSISGPGLSEIAVSDNGRGMDRHDILLALERHATSKLSSYDSLSRVETMGFRGEALPSIAGVSLLEIVSRPPGELAAHRVRVSGGRVLETADCGAPEGTTVRVRKLFFNTPARRKFLKSDRVEWGHIEREVIARALGAPPAAFLLARAGETVFSLPAASDLQRRVWDLWGKETAETLVPLAGEREGVAVSGFLSAPEDSTRLRKGLYILVNGRAVQDRGILFALREAMGPRLPRGVLPMGVLALRLDPAEVDVNIHPAKREVAFRAPRRVKAAVSAAVSAALGKKSFPASSLGWGDRLSPDRSGLPGRAVSGQGELFPEDSLREGAGDGWRYRLLGQARSSYLVVEGPEGLILIDQHAAHERVMFEKFSRLLAADRGESQQLLTPIPLELGALEAALLAGQVPHLASLGIEVEEFGPGSWAITALPALLVRRGKENLAAETLAGIGEWEKSPADPRREIVIRLACQAALKAGDYAGPEGAARLWRDLLACRDGSCCPHGRPTRLTFSWAELERKFGRRG